MANNLNSPYYSGNEEWINDESVITAEKMTNIENAFLNLKTDLTTNIENTVNSYFEKIKNETPAFVKYYMYNRNGSIHVLGKDIVHEKTLNVSLTNIDGYSRTNVLSFSFDLTGFQSVSYFKESTISYPVQSVYIEFDGSSRAEARDMTVILKTDNSKINDKKKTFLWEEDYSSNRGVTFDFSDEEMQIIIKENPIFHIDFSGSYSDFNSGKITSIEASYFKVDHYDLPKFSLESEVIE